VSFPQADILFESSWEVCNKVGGIYTVVSSKVRPLMNHYKGRRYICIGPYFPDNINGEFQEFEVPKEFEHIFEILRNENIKCYYGHWLLYDKPEVILIDFKDYFYRSNDIKKELWESHQIDSLGAPFDFDEPVVWSAAVARFLEEYHSRNIEDKIVAQFHEWMAGTSLLMLKNRNIPIGTVFTTHATMLGRTLASKDIDIYSDLKQIDPKKASYDSGMHYKHLTEVACAHAAEVFTTVSEITAMEAEHILGKKPDILLMNGVDMQTYQTIEENSIKHFKYREKIMEFITAYFFSYYQFDFDETLIYFTSGRYEYHVKGLDILIKSLSAVNDRLKRIKSNKTIVTFFFIPLGQDGIKKEILENVDFYKDIRDTFRDNRDTIFSRAIRTIISSKELTKETAFTKEIIDELEGGLHRFKKPGQNPPLCTHDIYNENDNTIINAFKENNLLNRAEDRVKVILYPIYLNGADGLLNTDYNETIIGTHLGIFPSYYEPWGYTPLETAAQAVPSITTDLGGFGRFIRSNFDKSKNKGIFILERLNVAEAEEVQQLTEMILHYTLLPKDERVENKINSKKLAERCDWSILIENYIEAHNLALTRVIEKQLNNCECHP
jgi:glycogen synthase